MRRAPEGAVPPRLSPQGVPQELRLHLRSPCHGSPTVASSITLASAESPVRHTGYVTLSLSMDLTGDHHAVEPSSTLRHPYPGRHRGATRRQCRGGGTRPSLPDRGAERLVGTHAPGGGPAGRLTGFRLP